jgi:murein L,D-transpeptidase YafK
LNRHTAWTRTLLASAAIASAVALAGCETDGTSPMISARALQPLSGEMIALLKQKNMPKESPVLVRIFKEEAEMEIWKQDTTGQYAMLKTYPICRWSGELGPKVKEGDRQAPEGFYNISPGQMNPNSNYYLSFNIGFPNAYDRANERTGAFLMVHGDCSSAGCYAMTDEQMGEIYALGRESLFGGQKSFQIQAYPFHMTALNLARHRNNPNMPFWRMIKEGNDHFELTRQEPKVDVCEKRYVFDAVTTSRFDPRGRCPAFQVPQEIATPVAQKQQRDDSEVAAFVARGTQTVAVKTGADGGMHPLFLAKLQSQDKFDNGGRIFSLAPTAHVPAMGNNVNPPRVPNETDTTTASVTMQASSEQAPAPQTRVASADAGQSGGSVFGSLFSSDNKRSGSIMSSWFGSRDSEPQAQPAPKPRTPEVKSAARSSPGAIRPTPAASSQIAQQQKRPAAASATASAPAPAPAPTATASAAPAPAPGLIAGAQPVISSNNFEGRWGGLH